MNASNSHSPPPAVGTLILMPNSLDFSNALDQADLISVLPHHAIHTAARLEHWIVENAKTARAFLNRIKTITPLTKSLQELNLQEMPRAPKGSKSPEEEKSKSTANAQIHALLAPCLQGHDVGLLSEAGLPAVADPGSAIVLQAHRLGVPVLPLSGPSSLILALAASGLNGQSFSFVGYLPSSPEARHKALQQLEKTASSADQTQLWIETPYRNQAMLASIVQSLKPQTLVSISCGLTMPSGWSKTQSVAQWKTQSVSLPNDVPAVFLLLA